MRCRSEGLVGKPPEALAQTRALLRGDLAPLLARKQESEIFEQQRRSPEAQAIFAASWHVRDDDAASGRAFPREAHFYKELVRTNARRTRA